MTLALGDVPAPLRLHVALMRHLLGCFARNFAGRPHAACDRRLLAELIARLEATAAELVALPEIHGPVEKRLDMLRTLAREVAATDRSRTPEYAAHLAAAANQQFALVKRLVTGRAHRRRALVERIVETLAEIEREMIDVASVAAHPTHHEANTKLVTRELARIRAELDDDGLAQLTAHDQLRILAAAATAERDDYHTFFLGRERNTVDVEQLAGICERLGELTYQIAALPAEVGSHVLQQVVANLDAFEVEFNILSEQRKRALSFTHVMRSAASLRAELAAADAPESVRTQAIARLDALLEDSLVTELAER